MPELRRGASRQRLRLLISAVRSAVIDVHTHVVPNGWPDLAVVTGSDGWPWLRVDSERAAMIMVGEGEYRPIGCACWSAAERLADMDADGIDRQVVSPTPLFFGYERDADRGDQGGAGSSTT